MVIFNKQENYAKSMIDSQYKALRIYKKIHGLKKALFSEINGEIGKFEKNIERLLHKEKLDQETMKSLAKLLNNSDSTSIKEQLREMHKNIAEIMVNTTINETNDIILTSDGDLYREPKEKYYYPITKEAKRLQILQTLGKKYKSTEDIKNEAEIINKEAVRKYIGEINTKAKSKLKISNKLIESKPGSGYRISNLYNLIKE